MFFCNLSTEKNISNIKIALEQTLVTKYLMRAISFVFMEIIYYALLILMHKRAYIQINSGLTRA